MGSLALTGIVIVVAFPLGVGAAIYLEEYANDSRLNRLLVANIRNLAGVPSIVYGLLGLGGVRPGDVWRHQRANRDRRWPDPGGPGASRS